MKTILLSLIILLFIASGCNEYNVSPIDKKNINIECTEDTDCVKGGCSGQLCLPESEAMDILTTCEFKPEYECLKLTSCSCIEGSCGWTQSDEYSSCLEGKKNN